MKKNPQIKSDNELLSSPSLMYQQKAEKLYNIGNIKNFNTNISLTPPRVPLLPNRYFNLFVINNQDYNKPSFMLDNARILEQVYTTTALRDKLSSFTIDDIEEIIQLPTLFLPEKTEQKQIGFLGKLTDIDKTVGNGISEFWFTKEKILSLDKLKSYLSELQIKDWELQRTHWAIKKADLQEIIDKI